MWLLQLREGVVSKDFVMLRLGEVRAELHRGHLPFSQDINREENEIPELLDFLLLMRFSMCSQ
jgi:hypothetical protein